MNEVVHLRQIIQVKKQRANSYTTVDLINTDGSIKKRDKTTVVKFPEHAKDTATAGSLWEVSGKERLNHFTINDFPLSEYTIDAANIKFLRPSGRILSRWISNNIKGIGSVIANRLVRLKKLAHLIEAQDTEALLNIAGMTESRVKDLLDSWPSEALFNTINWLEEQNLPLGFGEKLVTIFGEEAIDKVKEHPFLLVAMGASFEQVSQLALKLGFTLQDEVVVAGIAQYAAINHANKTGSTVISNDELHSEYAKLMKSATPKNVGEIACEQGLLVKVTRGYQVYGKALMEAAIAQFIVDAHQREAGDCCLLAGWEIGLSRELVQEALTDYERTLDFNLTDDQRDAIIGAVISPVCGISGGAGTGKTTILKAVLGVYDRVAEGVECYQVALAGRAAQRMAESTQRPAKTIAKFIGEHLGDNKPKLPEQILLVIDESSMVDLLSMYRLIGLLPDASRVIFVGDTAQLPPVGNGLVFHALTDTQIPFFNLTQVKRQSKESDIHRFSTAVRNRLLQLPQSTKNTLKESSDCSLEASPTISRLIALWRESGGIEQSIILSPIRKGEFGVDNLNTELQESIGNDRQAIYFQDSLRGWIPWITSTGSRLLEGDPVLVIANNYDEDADLRNGDLGVIVEVSEHPDDGVVAIIEVNNVLINVTAELLEKLHLGYAITIHKSQGSQWPTCFVMLPQESEAMIDQTLLYTASTRPSERLVLMGYQTLVAQAIKRGSIALNRKTFLRERIDLTVNRTNE
ncbi:exodeoxyribonuclease V alpha subunit [Pseudoalteromonas citrea]|uniref:Exodeoxyribonuclease V alpha subunit n=3 Tax=Pseudoalteromonadaceae TaxID=267888 RepID=A0AAD4ANB4_9GAMM|nr:AAA family ATPase [Pseudoalteromonas citrea]KAF7775584.1 exodeoxyribonuclease V alpha subunit [Pseudoalteromonas citrea]